MGDIGSSWILSARDETITFDGLFCQPLKSQGAWRCPKVGDLVIVGFLFNSFTFQFFYLYLSTYCFLTVSLFIFYISLLQGSLVILIFPFIYSSKLIISHSLNSISSSLRRSINYLNVKLAISGSKETNSQHRCSQIRADILVYIIQSPIVVSYTSNFLRMSQNYEAVTFFVRFCFNMFYQGSQCYRMAQTILILSPFPNAINQFSLTHIFLLLLNSYSKSLTLTPALSRISISSFNTPSLSSTNSQQYVQKASKLSLNLLTLILLIKLVQDDANMCCDIMKLSYFRERIFCQRMGWKCSRNYVIFRDQDFQRGQRIDWFQCRKVNILLQSCSYVSCRSNIGYFLLCFYSVSFYSSFITLSAKCFTAVSIIFYSFSFQCQSSPFPSSS